MPRGEKLLIARLGNCNSCEEWKISFMNEMKWNEIGLNWKFELKKIFWTLSPNFGKGHDKSCQVARVAETIKLFTVIMSRGEKLAIARLGNCNSC